MKIGLISFGYPDNYYRVKYIFTHELVQSLNQKVEIIVFDLSADPTYYNRITLDLFEGIKVYRIPPISSQKCFAKKIKLIRSIISSCNSEKVDFILYNFLNINHLFLMRIFPSNIHKGVIVHGVDAMALWENPIIRFGKRLILKKMDYVFPVSDFTNMLVQPLLPIHEYTKIHLFYNGIKKEKFLDIFNSDKLALKKEMGIPNKKVILSICDLIPRKGIDICIKADKLLKNKGLDFTHIIIGRGPEKNNLLSMAKDLGLDDIIIWIDYVAGDEELVKYYWISDVYTMISKTTFSPLGVEGFGISYIEAQYLGIPVVGGNSGGVSTAVKHGFTGYLIDPNQQTPEKEVASYILKILTDDELYTQLSKNAHDFVNENFDWGKNSEIIMELIT